MSGSVLDKRKMHELVVFSNEAWFTLRRNKNSKIKNTGVPKSLCSS
jgi:hypothetical protein